MLNLNEQNELETDLDIKEAQKLEVNGIEYLEFPKSNISVTTTSTAYGYSVDEKGFMGADFNAAAGLPQDFKIHKSTLDEFVEVSQKLSVECHTSQKLLSSSAKSAYRAHRILKI